MSSERKSRFDICFRKGGLGYVNLKNITKLETGFDPSVKDFFCDWSAASSFTKTIAPFVKNTNLSVVYSYNLTNQNSNYIARNVSLSKIFINPKKSMLITKFVDKRIEKSSDTQVKAKFVYLAYRKFVENSNSLPLKYMDFRSALEEQGIRCIKFRNVYFFQDIALVQEEEFLNLTKAFYHL